ncbi:MAG TPA: hypothetical protein VMH86_00335 [Rhizomicrobium sp.]|nr:hypothetical protein [Rhizomicrobium sp.]
MQLRTFVAGDMQQALAHMRREMGPNAIIVSSQRAREGGVLVRAALDEPETDLETAVAAEQPEAIIADFETGYRDNLMRRLRESAPDAARGARAFGRAELISLLREQRAPDSLGHALAEAAEKTGLTDMTLALASALDKRMQAEPIELSACPALLLVGPHGAGKTATAAKLAAHARLIGRAVALIATDPAGAGAIARLETFATHVGASFEVAETAEETARLVAASSAAGTLAIVDTAGFDPRDGKARAAFTALAQIADLEAIGVVSANGDSEETAEIVSALSLLGARRIVVTCLDTARRSGALVAAACEESSLAFVTRSPFVAGGLDTLTPLSLARLIVETSGQAGRGSAQ